MSKSYLGRWMLIGSALWVLSCPQPIAAQVVPDDTLPVGERSQVSGNPNFQVDGGARRGGNLFHSFSQFSVPTGGSAFFNNATDVQNIFSRVTGGSASNIDGIIRANGTANLFLLNPSGILFGPNASLNIGGSFIATTANSINFADNFQYSATNPQTTSLLTVSVPVGLQMGTNPGRIEVQGNGYNLSGSTQSVTPVIRGNASSRLQVPTRQTLTLLGGDINIQGGMLTAEQGRIELGSARDGIVNLGAGFALSYSRIQGFGDIHLSQRALADASGSPGGSIQVQGNRVLLTDGSLLLIQNQGEQAAGSLQVNATDSLELSGVSPDGQLSGGLNTGTTSSGRGADIVVSTRQLLVQDGAGIINSSYGAGRGGDVTVAATDSIQLIGYSLGNLVTRIAGVTSSSGNGGNITLSTGRLSLLNGALIGTSPLVGSGNAGNLTINATDLVELIGFGSASISNVNSTAAIGGNTGNAGNVTINTSRLVGRDGGTVTALTFGAGRAGSITINATESVEFSGVAQLPLTGIRFPSQVSASAQLLPPTVFYPNTPIPNQPSGNVSIYTGRLSVTDGAKVDVSHEGTGSAGTLQINANSILLDRGGSITAATASGEGGSINLNVRDTILLRNNSPITASAGGTGNGGTIDITAGTLSLLGDTQLSTAASGVGNAGDITVSADAVRLSGGAQLLTSTSSRGQAGNITLNTPNLQLSGRTSGLFAGTTSTGNAGNLTIQPRGDGQAVRVDLQDGAQISASTSSSGRGGQLTITAPESITLTGNGSIISAETSGSGIGGNLTLQTGDLNIQNQAQVTVSSSGRGSAGSLFVDADRIFLDNGGRIRADTSGGGGNISLRSPFIVLRNGSNITTNATGANIPGGNIDIDTRFLVAVPNENSNISANSQDFRGGNVSINAIALYGIQPSSTSTPLSDITATGATSALPGTVDVTTATIDPTSGLVALPADVVDASQLIAQGCPADEGNSFVVTGRGGLPPTPEQQLDDDADWQDRRRLTIPQQTAPQQTTPDSPSDRPFPGTADALIVEATGWQTTATGEVRLVATPADSTVHTALNHSIACEGRD
ncbi:filamentous hemagglutinin N-terminal domain-containing protein [Leptolyngbya sp. ST-U4]|uniref:two-partner secretion domain-containing protein n=1 Tax=Leptolyngbya sp. ST-U4 TaxID=2933912 RepID=UPI0019C66DE4|nr:filamentous hemagglutinin N-terminal domain-containing protein [Cyanobacteria bacterium FACHB-502]